MKTPCLPLLFILVGFTGPLPAQTYYFTTIAGQPGIPGGADGTNNNALFYRPSELALDSEGALYVSDTYNNTIRRVAQAGPNWVVTTIAGTPGVIGMLDGTNSDAQFNAPNGIAVGPNGDLFVADHNNHTLRKLVRDGTNWIVTTIAGMPGVLGTADGTNNAARFRIPIGIAADAVGRVFVVDTANFTIRMVAPEAADWIVSTIAGTPLNYGFQDGLNDAAAFNFPYGIDAGPDGALYLTDAGNNAVRKISPVAQGWNTETIANYRGDMGSRDGNARFATFDTPNGIALDPAGNIFVADQRNHTIRKLTFSNRAWDVSTIAGAAGVPGTDDGAGPNARFRMPWGIVVDPAGNLFIADAYNHTIRMGVPGITLEILVAGGQVILSWPVSPEEFQLQRAAELNDPAAWETVTSGIVTVGNRHTLTNELVGQAAFYRLQR